MTTFLDRLPLSSPSSFEETNQKRLDLIDTIDETQRKPDSLIRRIRTAYLSRKALSLAKRPEIYTVQKEDLIHRAAAINPHIEDKAHKILDQVYTEDHPELTESTYEGLPPAIEVAHLALEKTVEVSLDMKDDEDTPTVPIPVDDIVRIAVEIINAEQSQHIPASTVEMERAWEHKKQLQADQKELRIQEATEKELSEEEDAMALTPEQMQALLDEDDEIEIPVSHSRAA